MTTTVRDALIFAIDAIGDHNGARDLLVKATGLPRHLIIGHPKQIISVSDFHKYKELVFRRREGEPIAYILGHHPFREFLFKVNKNVLIPRPETELLVEEAIKLFTTHHSPLTIADLGTGSGCIAVSLAKHFKESKLVAVDKSPESLKVAKANALNHGVEKQIEFIEGDFLVPLHGRRFELIISNPPYIPHEELDSLMRDVKDYEPHQALDGGIDGLDYIRKLISDGPKYAKRIIFEIGFNQADAVRSLCPDITIKKDYSGIERIAILIE